MIKIEHLSSCEGADKFGTCSGCLRGNKEVEDMIRITIFARNGMGTSGASICLCTECKKELYDLLKEEYEGNGKNEARNY